MSADDNLTSARAAQEALEPATRRPPSTRRNAVQATLQRYLTGELRIARREKAPGDTRNRKA
jgi:hypothetical protein